MVVVIAAAAAAAVVVVVVVAAAGGGGGVAAATAAAVVVDAHTCTAAVQPYYEHISTFLIILFDAIHTDVAIFQLQLSQM